MNLGGNNNQPQNGGNQGQQQAAAAEAVAAAMVAGVAGEALGLLDEAKAKEAVGTVFDERALQLGAALKEGKLEYMDPIVGEGELFPGMAFFCVPHVGVYGGDYSPTPPFLTVRLPLLGRAQVPLAVANVLGPVVWTEVEAWVVFHSRINVDPGLALRKDPQAAGPRYVHQKQKTHRE